MTASTDAIDRLNRLRSISDLCFAPGGDALIATIRPAVSEGENGPKPHIWRFALDGAGHGVDRRRGHDTLRDRPCARDRFGNDDPNRRPR